MESDRRNSNTEILERLKREGLKLSQQRLTEIFHNPFYCGKIRHYYLGDKIVKGKQEVLIDKAVFNKVNGIATHSQYEHSKIAPDFPLKRHIICGECGRLMTGYKAKGIAYYKCNTVGCCNNHRAEKLHTLYADVLDAFKIPPVYIPILESLLKKVFNEFNSNKLYLKKDLTKKRTECKKHIEEVNVRYGLGQIKEEVYSATIKTLRRQLADIESGLEENGENLSNLSKFIPNAIASLCELSNLWKKGRFEECQKIQNLVFPDGIVWKRDTGNYLTKTDNSFLDCVASVSAICKNGDIKKSEIQEQISDLVALF